MSTSVTLAAVQAEPVWLDAAATVGKTIALIEQAAAAGADLVAFPESWVPGYPVFLWTESVPEQMPYVARYHANSLTVDGALYTSVREAARRNNVMVAFGFSEKAYGSLYMAQSIISADGEILHHRRKLKPTHVERTLFGESDGSGIRVAQTPIGRVGALNCWEHLQPLTKYAMYAQNEQIHVAGWPCFGILKQVAALSAEASLAASKTYALEGGAFVIVSSQIISDEGASVFARADGSRSPVIQGGGGAARIYGPDSALLTEPLLETEEGIVTATVDLSTIDLAKNAADPAGHYARPDVTQLVFHREPQRPVIGEGKYGSEVQIPELEPLTDPAC